METTVYLSTKLMKIFNNANIVECSKLADNEGVIICVDSTLDAVLEGKQQISSSKAAVKLIVESENFKNFFKGLELKENILEETENSVKNLKTIKVKKKEMTREELESLIMKHMSLKSVDEIVKAVREEVLSSGFLFNGKVVSNIVLELKRGD